MAIGFNVERTVLFHDGVIVMACGCCATGAGCPCAGKGIRVQGTFTDGNGYFTDHVVDEVVQWYDNTDGCRYLLSFSGHATVYALSAGTWPMVGHLHISIQRPYPGTYATWSSSEVVYWEWPSECTGSKVVTVDQSGYQLTDVTLTFGVAL